MIVTFLILVNEAFICSKGKHCRSTYINCTKKVYILRMLSIQNLLVQQCGNVENKTLFTRFKSSSSLTLSHLPNLCVIFLDLLLSACSVKLHSCLFQTPFFMLVLLITEPDLLFFLLQNQCN